MRVLLVSPRYAPDLGGVERHVARLATGFVAAGHEVDVIAQAGPATVPGTTHPEPGLRVRRYPVPVPSRHFALSPGVMRAVLAARGADYDIAHAHSYHGLAALAAAIAEPAPLVLTPHYHGTGHSPLRAALHTPYRVAGRHLFSRARSVICVSAAEAELVKRDFPGNEGKTVLIPNGVDADRLHPPDPDAHTVLVVTRLESYKRVDRVIGAVAHLPEPWRLVICGDGPARPALEAEATRLGLDGRVRFTGYVSDVELDRERAHSSVLATLSEQEAFGLGVAQAIASGMPLLASDIPAHRELLEAAGALGSLQPADADGAALARAILSARPAARPEATIPWSEVVRRTLEAYDRVRTGVVAGVVW